MKPAMTVKSQQGSVLFISLILLVAMTMIAVASARISTTQLRLVGNVQSAQLTESMAQLGIEEVVGRIDAFSDPTQAIEDTLWEVDVQAADSLTGAEASVTQGVRVRMLAGSCV
jgi:Tfp pilus assembly protein PilX